MSKIVTFSESDSHKMILKKFVVYLKKTAHFYKQIQSLKRQLASFLNSIDYTLPFSALDIDKKGLISQANIQLFLIDHKYFAKPIDINRYFAKYVHGKDALTYDDILQCLVPHSDYILMASTAKNITQTLINKQTSMYLCKRVQNKMVKNIVALIINTQIQCIKKAHAMMDDLTNGGHRVGAMLWRILDRNRDNCLDFQRVEQIGSDYGSSISQSQWASFINWHFRSHKHTLNRQDFMDIFDVLIINKRNGSACNYENFVQTKVKRKNEQKQRMKLSKVHSIVADRVQYVRKQQLKRTYSTQNYKNKKLWGQQTQQIIDPQKKFEHKTLLYSKIGYRNPSNLIKMSQFS